jgi:NAD(P)-dependent dehydrogenase (short-subunit alcohol dehydrogenase family)
MSTPSGPFTWIITGASRGFGLSIAEAALKHGDAVVAAVRRPDALSELLAQYPDRLEVVAFDAFQVESADQVVSQAVERFGRIDVLVNNAGRGYVGAAEEISDAVLREALTIHVLTPAALVRAAAPIMRKQGSGAIVQMSSQGGRQGFAGVGTYCAAKHALEGYSEALAGELAPFGVQVMIVEPSRFRTGFNEDGAQSIAEVSETYRDALAATRKDLMSASGRQEGDPDRAAAVIVDLVHGAEPLPLRLPLGAEAVERISKVYERNLAAIAPWAELARSTDFPDAVRAARPF